MSTDFYKSLLESAQSLVAAEDDLIANLELGLVVGPFQGKPACTRIAVGKGVCGTAAATQQTQFVPDVHQFEGHIACDSDSNSEIVVPVIVGGKVVAVFDLDNKEVNGWDEEDKLGLEAITRFIEGAVHWESLL